MITPIAVLEDCVGFDHDSRSHPSWSNYVIARSGTTKQSHYWLIGDCFGLCPRNDNLPIFSPTQTDITFENPFNLNVAMKRLILAGNWVNRRMKAIRFWPINASILRIDYGPLGEPFLLSCALSSRARVGINEKSGELLFPGLVRWQKPSSSNDPGSPMGTAGRYHSLVIAALYNPLFRPAELPGRAAILQLRLPWMNRSSVHQLLERYANWRGR